MNENSAPLRQRVALLALMALFYMPFYGLAFVLTILAAAVSYLISGSGMALGYLHFAAWAYLFAAVFTLGLIMTIEYQVCCAGTFSFSTHLRRHYGFGDYMGDLFSAALWPLAWIGIDHEAKRFQSCFVDVVFASGVFWFTFVRRRSASHEEPDTDGMPVFHTRTPQEVEEKIRKALHTDES